MSKTLERELLEDADFLDQTAENIEEDNPLNADELRGYATILRLRAKHRAGKVLVKPTITPVLGGALEGSIEFWDVDVSAEGATNDEVLIALQERIDEREAVEHG